MTSPAPIIGVDFGTSTSLVGYGRGLRRASVVPVGRTRPWLPSVVAFEDGRVVVGEDAEGARADKILRSIKRAITENRQHVHIGHGANSVEVEADEVITSLLTELVRRARDNGLDLRQPESVRLGCPASWTGTQRRRLVQAAEAAGMDVGLNTLIEEPVAAGVAWAVEETKRKGRTINGTLLVFDVGGGTLDIAVLDVRGEPGEDPEIRVRASVGITQAGDALDVAIADSLERDLDEFGITGRAVRRPELLRDLLMRSAREAKEALSTSHDHEVLVPYPHLRIPRIRYTRERLEDEFRPQLALSTNSIWAALRQARTSNELGNRPSDVKRLSATDLALDIDYVLLAGGLSRVPMIAREMERIFPHAELYLSRDSAQELVVRGLSETVTYERLNLLRPGFDFVIKWRGRTGDKEYVLYPAYSAFYDPQLAFGTDNISYTVRPKSGRDLPQSGSGLLVARASDGNSIGFKVKGDSGAGPVHSQGFELKFGNQPFVFRLSTNGEIFIRDGAGYERKLRIDKWPVLRGRDHAVLWANNLKNMEALKPSPKLPWHLQDW